MKCLKCNNEIVDSSKYCPFCGIIIEESMTKKIHTCQKCNKNISPNSVYCEFCGFKVIQNLNFGYPDSTTPSADCNDSTNNDYLNKKENISPTELKNIYSESDQSNHNKISESESGIENNEDKEFKGVLGKRISYLVAVVFCFVIFFKYCNNTTEKTNTTNIPKKSSPELTINASVRDMGEQFEIENKNNFTWNNVSFRVNSKYRFTKKFVDARTILTIGKAQFVTKDGSRLNYFLTKSMNFYIYTDEGSYYAKWE
ncbi:MAG TPA: hypothetical protein DC057_17285 [Spirochaetia bacterium]|nr:hypothetical protein [Spirochaetia bacterium]